MSNRVLKKLYGDSSDLNLHANIDANRDERAVVSGDSESDSLSNHNNHSNAKPKTRTKGKKLAVNRFELLNNFDHNSMSDTEAKEDDDKDNDSVHCVNFANASEYCGEKSRLEKQDSTQSTDSLKKKRKKKKKVRSQKSIENELDDIEATVEEVNKMLGNTNSSSSNDNGVATHHHESSSHHQHSSGSWKREHEKHHNQASHHKKSALHVEHRHLNAENEMKRFFGSKVIQAEQLSGGRRRGRGRPSISRSWVLVNPRNWQNVGKIGLSMQHMESKGDVHYFNIVHSKSYQTVQFQFLDAVESYNPDNLVAILNAYPYHIDTLLQFSDVCKMAEDHQMAAELIERALYCIEHIFHPLFNVTQGNCRLDYRRPENRAFYIALFKHLSFVGQRGCNRTALEFCKLILGLDIDGDPLSVLLMIDYYALRCEQFEYLVQLYDEWQCERNLHLLPNFRYSVALALYYMSKSSHDHTLTDRSNRELQDALIMFPEFLFQLLDKCSVEPDSVVASCDYFIINPHKTPQAINQLIKLYIGRCHLLWKDKDIMFWLETNVREVIKRVKANSDPFVTTCNERRKKYFSHGTPRNVLRHVILSGIKEATLALPPDLAKTAIFGFDPLPPLDSIESYTRTVPTNQNEANDQGLLSVFLRSWLPDFNIDEITGRNRGAVRNNEDAAADAGVVAAARREPGDTNDLRRSVTSLLDAMRDLLSNIHMADVPHEGDDESDGDDSDENR